jgi:hypothetical protein
MVFPSPMFTELKNGPTSIYADPLYKISPKSLNKCGALYIQGPGSVVGIATAYGLDGPGIESRWGRDLAHLSRPGLRPTQPPVQWIPGLSRG